MQVGGREAGTRGDAEGRGKGYRPQKESVEDGVARSGAAGGGWEGKKETRGDGEIGKNNEWWEGDPMMSPDWQGPLQMTWAR